MDRLNPFPGESEMCNLMMKNYKEVKTVPGIAKNGPVFDENLPSAISFYITCIPNIPNVHSNPKEFTNHVADFLVDNMFGESYGFVQRPTGYTLNLTPAQLDKMKPSKNPDFFQVLMNVMLYIQHNDKMELWVPSTSGGSRNDIGEQSSGGAARTEETRRGDGERRAVEPPPTGERGSGDGERRAVEPPPGGERGAVEPPPGGERGAVEPPPGGETRAVAEQAGGETRRGNEETRAVAEPAGGETRRGDEETRAVAEPAGGETRSGSEPLPAAGSGGEPAPAPGSGGEPAPAEAGSAGESDQEDTLSGAAAAVAPIPLQFPLFRGDSVEIIVHNEDDVAKMLSFRNKVSNRSYKHKLVLEDTEQRIYASKEVRDQFIRVWRELNQRPTPDDHQAILEELAGKTAELTRVSEEMKTRVTATEHDALKQKLEAVENDLKAAETERNARIPLADYQAKERDLDAVREELRTALAERVPVVELRESQRKFNEARLELERVQNELAEEKTTLVHIRQDNEKLRERPNQRQYDLLKENLKDKDEENATLVDQVRKLQEQTRAQTMELASSKQLMDQFQSSGVGGSGADEEMQNLRSALVTLNQAKTQAINRASKANLTIETLEARLQAFDGVDVAQLQGDLENARRALSAAEEEKKRLHDALAEAEKEKKSSGEKLGEESRLKEAANAAKAEADQEIARLKAANAETDQEIARLKAAKAEADQEIDRLKAANAEAERRLQEAVIAAGNPLPPPIPAGSQADAVNLREQEVRRREDEVQKQELYTDFMAIVQGILGHQEMDSIAGNSHREKALEAVRKLASNARISAAAHRGVKTHFETNFVHKKELENAIAMNKVQHDALIEANLNLLMLTFESGKLKKDHFTSITVPLQEAVFGGSGEMLRWADSRTKIFPLFENDEMWQNNIVSAIMLGVGHATITDDARSMHDSFQYLEKISPEESFKEFLQNPSQTELNLIENSKNYKPIVFPIPRMFFKALKDMHVEMPPILLYFVCLMPHLMVTLLTKPDEIGDAMQDEHIFDHVTFRLDYLTVQDRLKPVASDMKHVWDRLKGTHLERTVQMAYLISSFIRQQQSAGARANRPAQAAPLRPSGAGGAAGDGGAGGAAGDGGAGGAAGAGGAGGAAGAGSAGAAAGDGGFGA
jgi:hypothetical protein